MNIFVRNRYSNKKLLNFGFQSVFAMMLPDVPELNVWAVEWLAVGKEKYAICVRIPIGVRYFRFRAHIFRKLKYQPHLHANTHTHTHSS